MGIRAIRRPKTVLNQEAESYQIDGNLILITSLILSQIVDAWKSYNDM